MSNLAKVLDHYGLFTGEEKYKIVCPFHGDVNASLLVDIGEDRWYCFGCNRSGSGLEFVKYAEPKLDMMEVYKLFYRILGGSETKVKIKVKTPAQVKHEKKRNLVIAKDYYFNLKTQDWDDPDDDMQYMIDRGFKPSILSNAKAKITYNKNYPIIFPRS
jgi:hypothetical protein